jgi:hypothetical protein
MMSIFNLEIDTMLKILIYPAFLLLVTAKLQAQFDPLTPPKKKVEVIKQRSPGLESTPTRNPTPAPAATYNLTAVKVNIGTGNDNKESLSNVGIELWARNDKFQIFAQNNLTNEMKKNENTPVGLERTTFYTSGSQPNAIPVRYNTSNTGTSIISLNDLQTYGLSLRIIYKPNFFADAWKIENVSVTLEFRDANNNLHPTLGRKTITFTNTSTFLDNYDKRILICTADNSFNPLTSFVTKDFSRKW